MANQELPRPPTLADVPDEVCLACVIFALPLHALESLRAVNRRWRALGSSSLPWQRLAATRWRGKSMASCCPLVTRLQAEGAPWRDVFWAVERDGARQTITEQELCRLRWGFSDRRQECDFTMREGPDGTIVRRLRMPLHGEMDWSFNPNGTLQISHFPEHVVERLDNWGWVIKNQFIFILSLDSALAESCDESNSAESDAAGAVLSGAGISSGTTLATEEDITAAFELAARHAGSSASRLTSSSGGGAVRASLLHRLMERLVGFRLAVPGLVPDEDNHDDDNDEGIAESDSEAKGEADGEAKIPDGAGASSGAS